MSLCRARYPGSFSNILSRVEWHARSKWTVLVRTIGFISTSDNSNSSLRITDFRFSHWFLGLWNLRMWTVMLTSEGICYFHLQVKSKWVDWLCNFCLMSAGRMGGDLGPRRGQGQMLKGTFFKQMSVHCPNWPGPGIKFHPSPLVSLIIIYIPGRFSK